MYLKTFGFTEKPFHITPNPRFIFLSKIHKEAFAHLLYGIQQRVGFMSLAGEIGTGKTTVLRTLLGQLEDAEYRVALIFNPCLTSLELLQSIHREFAIPFDPERGNLVTLHDSLNQFLLQQREAGKTVVLVVDEAQNLDPQVLEQLRLLSNLETETEKLIQMVLVGQPELEELLQRKDLRQLRQRLAVSYHLQPMDAEDTQRYVLHRVRIAGNQDQSLFTHKSLKQIYKYTGGTPRLINILCDRALLVAYSRDSRTVTRQDIVTAQKELRQQKTAPTRGLRSFFILLGCLILIAALVKIYRLPSSSPEPVEQSRQMIAAQQQVISEPHQEELIEPVQEFNVEQIEALQRKVAALTVQASGQQALIAIAEAWEKPVPTVLPIIKDRRTLRSALGSVGFSIAEIQISTADLLRMDVPVVLELTLPPNVVGKRFLAVERYRDGLLQTVPALNDPGWIDVAQLEALWFGKAWLPYINVQSIPLIVQPEKNGPEVAKVQQLLTAATDNDLEISRRYDSQTITAVTEFQRQMGLAPDGRVGAHTLFWLYRETGHKMPSLSGEDIP